MVWLQFMKEQKTHLTFRLGMGALSIAGENHSRNTQKTKQFIIINGTDISNYAGGDII